jgi:hypothetical protein
MEPSRIGDLLVIESAGHVTERAAD